MIRNFNYSKKKMREVTSIDRLLCIYKRREGGLHVYLQTSMSVMQERVMAAVRFVSTLLDHTTATVGVAFSWSMAQTVKVLIIT